MMILLTILLGAFWNRARGGVISSWFAPEDNHSKYDWIGRYGNALVFGLLCWCLTSSPYAVIAGFGGMMFGASFGWAGYIHAIFHSEYNGRKHLRIIDWIMKDDKYIKLRGIVALGLRGLVWTTSIAVPMAFFDLDYLWFVPVGLLMGLVYYVANRWNYSEYLWGAVLWGSFVLIN